MNIEKDLGELRRANIISQETADSIQAYYKSKGNNATNRLFIIFGILGAILVGLGIILIIAHNWDDLSRAVKTIFAFIPLVSAQLLCGYALWRKRDSLAWTESSSTFLVFAVGASIALVSQIYNIPGDTAAFLLTWMVLCLPLIYLMNSAITSLLYLCSITYYATLLGYFTYPNTIPWLYWLLLIGALPHYFLLFKYRSKSNFISFHHWIIPLSITIVLGTMAKSKEEFMFIAYISLFSFYYLIGKLPFLSQQKAINNGYKIIGALGSIILLLSLSFDWYWVKLNTSSYQFSEVFQTPELLIASLTSLLALATLFYNVKEQSKSGGEKPSLQAFVFILFIGIFFLGLYTTFSIVLINLLILAIALQTIWKGAKQGHLGILNYGLLIVSTLVVCRFFDTNISFVIRGIMFLIVGIGFFSLNYWMLKKRKTDES